MNKSKVTGDDKAQYL